MKKNFPALFGLLAFLLLVSIACQVNFGGPKLSGTPIPVSGNPAQTLERKLGNTFATPLAPGKFTTLVLSEQELTSGVNTSLQQSPDAPISNVQIRLRDQKMEIYGVLKSDLAVANVKLVLLPYPDSEGNLQISILSANIGPVPVFTFILSGISNTINDALKDAFTVNSNNIKFEKIAIADGQMTLTITVK